MFYPALLDLKNKLCVVIGGGKVAERKVRILLKAGALIKVISPEVSEFIQKLSEEQKIILEKRCYRPGDLEGSWLVVAATSDRKIQELIKKEADEKRIFCNVVDVPELCSFIVPSSVERGKLLFAISTQGASPAVAKRLRQRLENLFDESYADYIKLMEKIRKEILNSPLSQEEKEERLSRYALAAFDYYIKYKDFKLLKTILQKEGLKIEFEEDPI